MLKYMLEDVLEFSLYHCYSFFHVLTDTKIKHVSSTYYHSWYLVFESTFDVTYFHMVIDISCMRPYLMYQTLNVIFFCSEPSINRSLCLSPLVL